MPSSSVGEISNHESESSGRVEAEGSWESLIASST